MKQSKKQLRRRIKELEADNLSLAGINLELCLDIGLINSANRALQARLSNEIGMKYRYLPTGA